MTNIKHYPGTLHAHTDFSNFRLRDSINTVETLIDTAISLGHDVVAITEHETISSAIRAEKYYEKIKKTNPNFKMILGNEIYLVRNGLTPNNFNRETDKFFHFILLAKDAIGHQQIRELSTRAWMRSFTFRKMTRVPTYYQDIIDIIGVNPGHVIGSTACLGGQLPKYILDNNIDMAYSWCKRMVEIFGEGNFYLEMQPSNDKEQIIVNKKLLEISKELNIKYIITTDAHYFTKNDRYIHEAFLNAQEGDREVSSFYATTYLMNTEEIISYFPYFTEEELYNAFSNINEIKNSCTDYSLRKELKIPRLDWKKPLQVYNVEKWIEKIPYLNNFINSTYEGDIILGQAIIEQLETDEQYQNIKTYNEINACLKDILQSSEKNNAHWSAYFLNLQTIIDLCWEAGSIVGPGRGSGVGFIILNLLKVVQINPLREATATFRWRFLNPERVSVLDVDIDIEGSKRAKVLKHFREYYGIDRVANVLTLGTEKSSSAILTAARGLGIDIDIAQYLSSMIQSDRGTKRTLKQTFYGDEENGIAPNYIFRQEMEENYPKLWEVAQRIEGLICKTGIHAGGVIFVDEPFTNSAALMKAPSGEIITQFDLHDAEDVGLIKYDILSVEALDKIHNCLDLLVEYNYIEDKGNLRDTYESALGIYNIKRDDIDMWKLCWNHKVTDLFQMEQQSGIQGIAALKPTSVDELAILNSVIRLMAQEKGAEIPLQKLARFKNDPTAWDRELSMYGLNKKHKDILEPILGISYGLCIAQEQFMELVQLPECGGFDLNFADRLRKSIAKKNPAEYEKLTNEYFEEVEKRGCDINFCKYVWNVLIAMSKGYGFNQSHTLAYSLIGLQELNLAYQFPIIFWNTACLISNSGGGNENEEEEEENLPVVSDGTEEEEDLDETEEVEEIGQKKKKKQTKKNYGKVAVAIGKMKKEGINVSHPDINTSKYTFTPDVETNSIRYGLSGITRIGNDLVKIIISNRPYTSIYNFLEKVKVNKTQMINLIKSGAFDSFGIREEIMQEYVDSICGAKKKLNMQNANQLITLNLIPEELSFEKKVFNFNKYIRKHKDTTYFYLDDIAYNFYQNNFDVDLLQCADTENYSFKINQKTWDKIYKQKVEPIKQYIIKYQTELLNDLNNQLRAAEWTKNCLGNISKWEMDSISFYSHEHELNKVNNFAYNFANFEKLKEDEIDKKFKTKDNKEIIMYKIYRIAGTVLDRNKDKNLVTLLTTDGVVTVKIFGNVFNHYNKQISVKLDTGKKKIIEKSWFTKGNKIVVTGIKRNDMFIAKKYKNTPYHLVELITDISEDGFLTVKSEREGEEEICQ